MTSSMGKFLKNLLNGARQVLVLKPTDDYNRPSHNGFRDDANALRGDASKIAQGLKTNTKNYVQIHVR